MTEREAFLDRAYGLDAPDKTREFYRQWAKTYDDEVRANGYVSPARTAAAMAANVADVTAPLLDIGCGTGLSGEALRNAGFTTIDGTDFSVEMLAAAETKDIYRALEKGDLNDPIPAKQGDYENVTAVGVFSPGHAPPAMIDAVVALLATDGCFGFSLNDHALADDGYERRIGELVDRAVIEIVFKEYGNHLPRIDLKSKIYVLRKR